MNLLDNPAIKWVDTKGGERFDYPVDVSNAVLDVRGDGHIDILVRWAPNAYCPFHRHAAHTTSTVLQGEVHLVDYENGKPVRERVRKAGDYAAKEPGDVHMERGGPEGALVLFSFYAPDGKLFDLLDSNGATLFTSTVESMTSGLFAK